MKIKEFIPKGESTIDALIDNLKKRSTAAPNINDIKSQLDPNQHSVMSSIDRPNKDVKRERKVKNPETKKLDTIEEDGKEPVSRIALAMQELVVERAVAFLFGNEPKMNGDIVTDGQKSVAKFVEKIKTATKIDTVNRRAARTVFSALEVAEYWFPVASPDYTRYGVTTQFKLRCKLYDPLEGYLLFPRFDETGDLVAFSVEYSRLDGDETVFYFEVFTDEEKATFTRTGVGSWTVKEFKPVPIGKMPIIYGRQKHVEWYKIQNLIERLEKLLSNFADTNDYHASPKIFIEGVLKGFAKKGETGAILEGEKGSTAKYLSWDHAPESVKLEIDTLLSSIYSLTQTPNISFDNVKGLGAMSGVALKLLFLDAHLKVKNKEEIFGAYLQRRNSILTAYVGLLDASLQHDAEALDLYDNIEPFMIEDYREMVETLVGANGNNPIISQEQSVRLSPFADNPEEDYKRIVEETSKRNSFDVFERTE